MNLEGMDVDQVTSLARRIDSHTRTLESIAAVLGGLAAELSHLWHGPAAAAFFHDCETRHRPALGGAARAIAEMHAHLVANIEQQTRASAADAGFGAARGGGSGGGIGAIADAALGGVVGGVGFLWNTAKGIDDRISPVETSLDTIRELAGNDDVVGRYDKTWTEVMKLDRDGSLLKYKQSPVLHWLHDNPGVQKVGGVLDDPHAAKVLDIAGKGGNAIGLASAGIDGVKAGDQAFAHHNYGAAGGDLVDATATGLKTSKNPVAYLAGVDITLVKEDYDLAQRIDWKQGIPSPFSGDNFRTIYVPTFKSLPGQLVGPLEKAFF